VLHFALFVGVPNFSPRVFVASRATIFASRATIFASFAWAVVHVAHVRAWGRQAGEIWGPCLAAHGIVGGSTRSNNEQRGEEEESAQHEERDAAV
jgi:hypothetical protein